MSPARRACAACAAIVWAVVGSGCVSLSYDAPASTASPAARLEAEPEAEATSAANPETPSDAGRPVAEPENAAPDAGQVVPAPAADPSLEPRADGQPTRRRIRRETPTRARMAEQNGQTDPGESPRHWRAMAREARERVQEGDFERASELLEQAALQLKDRPPTHAPRRTVFGLRARHAQDLAAFGKLAEADLLADRLFDEFRAEPELGDAALVSLARATAERRRVAAEQEGRELDVLPLLSLALDAASGSTASRDRLALAFEVSNLALGQGELELARRAIDLAISDARTVAPGDRIQTASLAIYEARIALAQRDLAAAERAASRGHRLFEEIEADPSSRGVAEATLAQVLAEQGERDRALELARTAYARLSGKDPIVPHARRQIAASLARSEWLAGDLDRAGTYYREALAVPADGSDRDETLIRAVKAALSELESAPADAPADRS